MIHKTAIISESAVIAADVKIGPYTVINDDVKSNALFESVLIRKML